MTIFIMKQFNVFSHLTKKTNDYRRRDTVLAKKYESVIAAKTNEFSHLTKKKNYDGLSQMPPQ